MLWLKMLLTNITRESDSVRTISEKDYRKIKRLQEKFYDGVDNYCATLQDTSDFRDPFEMIMEIIDNARRNE